MSFFPMKLAVGCVLFLGSSTVLGQVPNQIFPPFPQNASDSRPDRGGLSLSTSEYLRQNAIIDLEMRDTLVYCCMRSGLLILDISDPTLPEFVSRLYLQEELSTDLKLQGQYVYLSTCSTTFTNGTLRIVDIADPATPYPVGNYPIASSTSGLDVVDSLAFVVMGESIGGFNAMFILNIVNPGTIVLVDSVPMSNVPDRVRVRGDYAYVTGSGGLCTIDISDPSDATLVSQFSPDIFEFMPTDLDLREDDSLLYIADLSSIWPAYWSAFSVYNVADPENPSLWGRFPLVAYVADVKVQGDYAYVSQGSCGLEVFDISDPTAPDSVGRYQTPSDWVNSIQSFAGRTAIQGDLLLLADIGPGMIGAEANSCYPSVPEPGDPSPGDLIILDISDPTEPTLVSHYTPDSLPTDVDDEDAPDALPASFALRQNYPNPFNPSTSVGFDLPRRSEIVLTVYNLLGQEITRLVQTRPAGSHTIELDLKDQPSGVYLYKLQAGAFSETRKMLLLK